VGILEQGCNIGTLFVTVTHKRWNTRLVQLVEAEPALSKLHSIVIKTNPNMVCSSQLLSDRHFKQCHASSRNVHFNALSSIHSRVSCWDARASMQIQFSVHGARAAHAHQHNTVAHRIHVLTSHPSYATAAYHHFSPNIYDFLVYHTFLKMLFTGTQTELI
jgi:hypothetical protein